MVTGWLVALCMPRHALSPTLLNATIDIIHSRCESWYKGQCGCSGVCQECNKESKKAVLVLGIMILEASTTIKWAMLNIQSVVSGQIPVQNNETTAEQVAPGNTVITTATATAEHVGSSECYGYGYNDNRNRYRYNNSSRANCNSENYSCNNNSNGYNNNNN